MQGSEKLEISVREAEEAYRGMSMVVSEYAVSLAEAEWSYDAALDEYRGCEDCDGDVDCGNGCYLWYRDKAQESDDRRSRFRDSVELLKKRRTAMVKAMEARRVYNNRVYGHE